MRGHGPHRINRGLFHRAQKGCDIAIRVAIGNRVPMLRQQALPDQHLKPGDFGEQLVKRRLNQTSSLELGNPG